MRSGQKLIPNDFHQTARLAIDLRQTTFRYLTVLLPNSDCLRHIALADNSELRGYTAPQKIQKPRKTVSTQTSLFAV